MFGSRLISLQQAGSELLPVIIALARLVVSSSSEQEYHQTVAIFTNYINPDDEPLTTLLHKLKLDKFSGRPADFVEEVDKGCWKLTELTKRTLAHVDAHPEISLALTDFLAKQRKRCQPKKRHWLMKLISGG